MRTLTSWSCWWETRQTWRASGPCPQRRPRTSQVGEVVLSLFLKVQSRCPHFIDQVFLVIMKSVFNTHYCTFCSLNMSVFVDCDLCLPCPPTQRREISCLWRHQRWTPPMSKLLSTKSSQVRELSPNTHIPQFSSVL